MKFLTILTLLPALASAAGVASEPAFFENHIRPVLVTECIECHGAEKQKGDLRLDYRDGWKKGGESGAEKGDGEGPDQDRPVGGTPKNPGDVV